MTDPDEPHSDPELRRWLRRWSVETTPDQLGRRVLESYEQRRLRSRRSAFWHARLSVPLPIAAVLVILLVTAGALAARLASRGERPESQANVPAEGSTGLADLKPLPEIRVAVIRKGSSDAGH